MNRHKIHFYFHAAATAQSQVMKMIDVHLHAAYRMTGSKRGREKQRKTGRMAAITLLNVCVCVCVGCLPAIGEPSQSEMQRAIKSEMG